MRALPSLLLAPLIPLTVERENAGFLPAAPYLGCSSDGTCRADGSTEVDCYRHETDDIVEWVEKNGGFVDKRLQIKSGALGRGFFASEEIKKGETIVKVPVDVCITDKVHRCFIFQRLRNELLKGKCSRYWPYLKFVRDVYLDTPSAWSVEELQVLDGLPPGDWSVLTNTLIKDCSNRGVQLNPEDPFALRAIFLYASRAGPEGIQPIFDIFNHGYNSTLHHGRNSNFCTFETSRTAKVGSELFNQFQNGVGTGMRKLLDRNEDPYGAPDIFRTYGFVEPPPTLWFFHANRAVYKFIQNDDNYTVSFLPKTMDLQAFVTAGTKLLSYLSKRSAAARSGGIPCLDPESQRRQRFCLGNPRRVALAWQYRTTFIAALKSGVALATEQLQKGWTGAEIQEQSAHSIKVFFKNEGGQDLHLFWLHKEQRAWVFSGRIPQGGELIQQTTAGHVFRLHADSKGSDEAIHEYVVRKKPSKQKVVVEKGRFSLSASTTE